MKNIMCLTGLFFYVIGSIGGFGYCMYSKAYVIAIAVVVLAVLAWPTAVKLFKFLQA